MMVRGRNPRDRTDIFILGFVLKLFSNQNRHTRVCPDAYRSCSEVSMTVRESPRDRTEDQSSCRHEEYRPIVSALGAEGR